MTDNENPLVLAFETDLDELTAIVDEVDPSNGVEVLAYKVTADAARSYVEQLSEVEGFMADAELRDATGTLRDFFNWWTYNLEAAEVVDDDAELAAAAHRYAQRRHTHLAADVVRLESKVRNHRRKT